LREPSFATNKHRLKAAQAGVAASRPLARVKPVPPGRHQTKTSETGERQSHRGERFRVGPRVNVSGQAMMTGA
jgi:hypothetical protein